MKTKSSKQPKTSKPAVQLKDLKPQKNPRGGDRKRATFSGGSVTEVKLDDLDAN